MNFAFAPGTSSFELTLRRCLARRANTTVISKKGLVNVADFIGELTTQAVTADDLLGGSHANDEGMLFLPLDSGTTTLPIHFEMLQAVDTRGTIKIPASVGQPTTNFHIKGCAIGSDDSLPFLQLLKQALDNPQSVTAPKYIYALYPFPGTGIFEFMMYQYRVMNIKAFTTRSDLIDAFKNGGFTAELDGTPVDPANWPKWIKTSLQLAPATSHKVQFNFPVKINPTTANISAIPNIPAQCRSRAERFTYRVTDPGGSIPSDKAGRLALLQSTMQSDPTFDTTHPYPFWARMHFSDFNSFFTGMDWKLSVKGNVLIGVGTHFVYHAVVPVLTPGTPDELIFNFYPPTGAPVMNFEEDNAAFTLFGVA